MTSRRIIVAVAAAVLGGCTVGPNYQAPKVAMEESFASPTTRPATTAPASSLTSEPMETARWWGVLHDRELDSLMDRVVASNLDVKIAETRLRQARAQFAFASGGRYPQADFKAAYSQNRLSKNAAPFNAFNVPGFPWEYNQYQAGFDASWELDLFGGVRREVEAAAADLNASAADRQNVLLSAMAEVARNYVDLRGLQQRYEIAEGNLRLQRETLDLTRDKRAHGLITELDVSQAASQVAKTEAQLPILQREQSEAIHRIAVLLGQQPEALTVELSKPSPVPVPPAQIAIGVPAELLRRRPDIRAAERQLAAATARIGQATAELFPKFSLTGNFMTVSAGSQNLFNWDSRNYGVGPTVTWPIFDAGRIRSVIDLRNAQQAQAAAQYERAVLGALEEVHNAIVTFVTEQQRHRALVDAVNADRTAAEVAEGQYKQGVVDFLHVLDAQRSLFESEDQLADSDRAVTTSLVALYKALAGGWEVGGSSPMAANH